MFCSWFGLSNDACAQFYMLVFIYYSFRRRFDSFIARPSHDIEFSNFHVTSQDNIATFSPFSPIPIFFFSYFHISYDVIQSIHCFLLNRICFTKHRSNHGLFCPVVPVTISVELRFKVVALKYISERISDSYLMFWNSFRVAHFGFPVVLKIH